MELIIMAGITLVMTGVTVYQSYQLRHVKEHEKELSAKPKQVSVSEPAAADLEAKLKTAYEAQIAASVQIFGADLKQTSARLGEQVSRLTTTVIEEELEEYQKTLEEMRATANEAMEKIRAAVEQQRVELRQGMETELAAERQRLTDKFNAKLGDVVSSYISESLGGGVDLGAQMQFILTSLESHKEDIKKDLIGGV